MNQQRIRFWCIFCVMFLYIYSLGHPLHTLSRTEIRFGYND